jgi:diaminopimelate epimerase
MTLAVAFVKYHGLGNDFAVIDARAGGLDLAGAPGRALCDRHTGIGADGVLLWTGSIARPHMQVVNADGSIAEMCGNGLRCFVKYLLDRHAPDITEVTVATGAGPLACRVWRDAHGRVTDVAVCMGPGRYEPDVIPLASTEPLIDEPLHVAGHALNLTALNTGNPHVVTFAALTPAERAELGPILCAHPLFPRQANVEFVQILAADGVTPRMQVDVFERGCGWTQACGTGATAATLVATRLGHVPAGREVAVKLPGGWLGITVDAQGLATMRGPAVEVFAGTVDLTPFLQAS